MYYASLSKLFSKLQVVGTKTHRQTDRQTLTSEYPTLDGYSDDKKGRARALSIIT